MRETLTTFGELLGAAAISYGFWLAWAPLGFMAAGALLIAICYLLSLDTSSVDEGIEQ